ncbi:NEL-type E3 ubiquitin ligase domain-containing protein [Pectobacterium parvum]|uniref:NEL-type E3 ubiquitin ligase domain-containing protein n=1 Tax=Pectobacterium parvum TaxID=2778550 RepID=UPI0038004C50
MPNFNIYPASSHTTTNGCQINNVRDQQHQSKDSPLWAEITKEWFPLSNQTHAEALLRDFYQPATDVSPRDRLFNFLQLQTLLSPEYQNNLVTERLGGKGETVCTIVPSGNDTPTSIALTLSEDDHNAAQGLIALHKWVCASPDGEAEKRHVAEKWIQACWKNNFTSLNLASLELTTLPDTLPQGITYLNVENNSLTTLPTLPQSITHLCVRDNLLTTLPALPQETTHLDVSDNPLTALPNILPEQIVVLDARNCGLETLPVSLPQKITRLNINNNRLKTLPNSLPQETTHLDVSANKLVTLPVSLPQKITHLNLSDNRLETLPASLPQKITRLNISNNRLKTLPDSLPQETTHLDVSANKLVTLPVSLPQKITYLNISDNRLVTLPDSLPQETTHLDVSANGLETLPVSLPQKITYLDASYNRLETLPVSLPQGIIYLDVSHNPFPPRPLPESVKDWQTVAISDKWAAFNDEQNAPAFSAFLDRLNGTKTAKNHPAFKNEISSWLTRLADDNKLREKTFSIATDATANCEDRVIFTYHQMKNAEITHRIESGEDDKDLPKLLGTGREVFRLEQLEHIARKKIQQLDAGAYAGRDVDEIEVFLGYQNSLRNKLELTTITPEMEFFGVSNITEEDRHQAEALVKTAEKSEFPSWFSQWAPWHETVARIAPNEWEETNNKKSEHYEKAFNESVETELKPLKLENDNDAIRALGVRVLKETEKTAFEAMTKKILPNKLFTSPWEPKTAPEQR